MHPTTPPRSRYELREVLGRGGMGVIFKAYDNLMRRDVALKTILDVRNKTAHDLFYREWGLQASITHPNIAEIYDIGEMEHEGSVRPYFVMPLLPGVTMADLIRNSSARLTVERALGMVIQACRGLQAAHDRGLIHRDLKPSNIFVLEDDSVKIIDFGIAHTESSAQTSVRGTLAYMAPELLQLKPATVASDIFALGVVCYEAITGRRPFEGTTDSELSRAILHHNPPAVSEIIPGIQLNVGRAIHKALAKQPWHRYASAREFGDTLDRAQRGEPIEFFDSAKVLPRVERASRAFERGEYQVATEILSELESEGHIEQEITMLRRQVEQAQRQLAVRGFLESARRFAEEEEFALALRKIQEALDLDPNNTDVHALKNEVEKIRRSKKIEEWAQLARRHLDNNAFAHARSAIQSLLELRPGEPNALALLAEIQRREAESQKVRQEKSRLVAVAREAWQRGEVTSALTHLERWVSLDREAPETDAERVVALQSFYKQVRGEHEAIKNSYDKARQDLAEGDYAAALGICNQYLSKYPSHALFQALKFDVEERQRQNLSSYIAETDRRVENEPDLDRRAAILEEALRQHPGEPHFERALRLTRDKRDLVNSVVSRARLHEDEGRFGEALDQWEVLHAIHANYPGLDYEIERVTKRRDAQARADARSAWITRIDAFLENGEYDRAVAAAEQSLSEFPADGELEELRKMAVRRRAHLGDALRLLEQGREAAAAGQHEEALNCYREAYHKDETNPVIKSALVNALAIRAKALAETDPEAADVLLAQVLELDPGHTLGLNLRAMRADKQKEEFIAWCTAQARRLQAAGDLEGALVIVQEGLSKYPNDARLNQLYSTLDRSTQNSGIRVTVPPVAAPEPPAAAAPAPPAPRAPMAPPTPPVPPAQPTPAAEPPVTPPPAPSPAAPVSAITHVPPSQPVSDARPAQAAPTGAAPAAGKNIVYIRYALVAAATLIVATGVYTVWRRFHPPAPVPVRTEIKTNPPGAKVSVAGQEKGVSNLTIELLPGEYRAAAELEGYQPAFTSFTVKPGAPVFVELALQPWRPAVRLFSEAEVTQATLSDRPFNPGAPGEFALESIDEGSYQLKVTSPLGQVSAGVQLGARSTPLLTGPIQAKNLGLLIIGHCGTSAVIYSSSATLQAGLDGQPAKAVPAEGLALGDVKGGPHQLDLSDGAKRSVKFTMSAAPGIQAFVLGKMEAGTGSILVVTGEDGASVTINGFPHWLKTSRGQVRIGSLKPGVYKIRVSKDGFEAPPALDIEAKAGEEVKAEIKLKQVVKLAQVHLTGAAGAQVFLDGQPAGAIGPDGLFTFQVAPGSHAFELRRGQARSKPHQREIKPGETVQIAMELEVAQNTGTVRFEISPLDATLLIRRAGEAESQARPVNQNPLTLPEGAYVVSATAPRHVSAVMSLSVQAGTQQNVPIALRPLEASNKKAATETHGIGEFEDARSWTRDGEWSVRKGGKFVLYQPANLAGVYTFQIQLRHGKRLQWVLNYADQRNHALFRMDKKYLYRLSVVNGKTTEGPKAEHRQENAAFWELRITVEPNRIVHEIREGDRWVALDTLTEPRDLSAGKFGFFIPDAMLPGADEYAVRNFSFVSRPR